MKFPTGLTGRSLLTLNDVSDQEMLTIIDFASELKRRRKAGIYIGLLEHKSVAMVFEKASTRTRR